MFFVRRPDVVVINRQSLEYFRGNDHLHLEFPTNVVNNLEIVDQEGWKKLINDFKVLNKVENISVLVFYSPEATFEKPFVKDETLADQIKKFYDEIPILPEKLLKKEIEQKAAVLGIAVNKELYAQFLPSMVIPLSPLGVKNFDWKIVGNQKKLNEYCLWKSGTQSSGINKTYLEIFALIVVIVLGVWASYFYFFKKSEPKPKSVSETEVVILTTPTPAASISATAGSKKDLKTLKIQILNGSGKTGLAGKGKQLLVEAGFTNVETGNSTDSASVIKFSSSDFVASISAILKDLNLKFSTVSANLNDFDLVINLGKK